MDISIFSYIHISLNIKFLILELHAFILFNVKNLFECKLLALAYVEITWNRWIEAEARNWLYMKWVLYEIQYVLLKSMNYIDVSSKRDSLGRPIRAKRFCPILRSGGRPCSFGDIPYSSA